MLQWQSRFCILAWKDNSGLYLWESDSGNLLKPNTVRPQWPVETWVDSGLLGRKVANRCSVPSGFVGTVISVGGLMENPWSKLSMLPRNRDVPSNAQGLAAEFILLSMKFTQVRERVSALHTIPLLAPNPYRLEFPHYRIIVQMVGDTPTYVVYFI